MNKITASAANTQRARLPAIHIPPGVDAALRQTLDAIKERLEVRDGARGNPYERGLTVRDLVDAGLDVTVVGQRLTPGSQGRLAPNLAGGSGAAAQALPSSIEALVRSNLSRQAEILGADIRRMEHKFQSALESSASVVEQLTASLGQVTGGVRQISYANATANRATAGKLTQLAAALDGTGSATLDESMVVIADRMQGLRSQYMLTLGAGRAVAGISLLASEDPQGLTESAFVVQADRFQVKTANGTRTPFGIDGENIYLNGTVRINAGGQELTELAANAAVPAMNFIGTFAVAPSATALKKNSVYRNSANGNSYILSSDGGVWQLYLERGANGVNGARGSVTLYQSGAWSDAGATAAVQAVTGTVPTIGDTVTFSDGSAATTRYWSGSAWVNPGVVINGNLLVGGVISSTSVDTVQYVRAKGLIEGSDALGGATRSAIRGENSSHNGWSVIGFSTSSNAAGGGMFSSNSDGPGVAGYGRASSSNGVGVFGQAYIGVQGRSLFGGKGVVGISTLGVGVECQGAFRFGSVQWDPPDNSASKYMDAAGNWKRPNLSDILPNTADTPGFQFSTDGGATWTPILLRRV